MVVRSRGIGAKNARLIGLLSLAVMVGAPLEVRAQVTVDSPISGNYSDFLCVEPGPGGKIFIYDGDAANSTGTDCNVIRDFIPPGASSDVNALTFDDGVTSTEIGAGGVTTTGTVEADTLTDGNGTTITNGGVTTNSLTVNGNSDLNGNADVSGLLTVGSGLNVTNGNINVTAGGITASGVVTGDKLVTNNPSSAVLGGSSLAAINDTTGEVAKTNVTIGPDGSVNAGTVNATNVNATNVGATNVTATNVGATNVTATNVSTTNFTAAGPASVINMNGARVQGVGAPIAGTDAANKDYVDAGLNAAFKKIDENTEGIAVAIALGGIAIPEGKNFALAANLGFYDGKEALAAQTAIRLDPNVTFNGGVGVGLDNNKVGGRVGIMTAW